MVIKHILCYLLGQQYTLRYLHFITRN